MGRILGRGRYVWGTYADTGSSGGSGAAGVPLSRQRFIDGDTSQAGLNGSAAEPFKTIAEFMASRTNVSSADAFASYVGWMMPSILGYGENVSFPPYASTELRADSLSLFLGGVTISGNVTWANIAGANAGPTAAAVLHNLTVAGNVTITDDVNAPASVFVFSGDEVGEQSVTITGTFVSNTTTKLASALFSNAAVNGNIDCGNNANSAAVALFNTICGGSVVANQLNAINSSFDSAAIITIGPGTASFQNSIFATGSTPALDCIAGATFDGPSWNSFMEAGGIRAFGAIVLVVGGYSAGAVEGAALTGLSTNVSLNGTGATAGYTGNNSGNHYSTSNSTPTSVTLKTGGGEFLGDTILITKTDTGANALAVKNNAGATIGTIPTLSRGFVLARFDGSDWVFVEGGSLLA